MSAPIDADLQATLDDCEAVFADTTALVRVSTITPGPVDAATGLVVSSVASADVSAVRSERRMDERRTEVKYLVRATEVGFLPKNGDTVKELPSGTAYEIALVDRQVNDLAYMLTVHVVKPSG